MAELPKFVIGRGEQADYRVNDEYASSEHAIIRALGRGRFTIEDCGTTNGTWLNGERVWGPVELLPADVVRVGRTAIGADGLLLAFAIKVGEADRG